jgi:Pyruvate/2-oxoacid:ferredoxin oxidoreductase delta subunit
MAVSKLPDGYAIRTEYCKGCGLCVKECPTGAIQMRSGK